MILGITGGTGSGKTTLLDTVRKFGGTVIDCDEVYHRLLKEDAALVNAISARFPGTVEDGVLQRKKLGAIVFSDKNALRDLDIITHSEVKNQVLRHLELHPKLAAIDAIALHESGLAEICDVTVAVTAPMDVRLRRLMERDCISAEYAQSRIAAQPDEAWFRENCDYLLENTGTKEEFQTKCLAFFKELGIMEIMK